MEAIKLLVTVKRTVDYRVKVHVKPDGSGIALSGLRMEMNPFDAIALEAAVRFKEAGVASEVVAVTVGNADSEEVLRTALAMGANRAIRIATDAEPNTLEPFSVAKLICALASKETPDLILMGKQAIDDDCNQTGQLLAALLDWPQATFASDIQLYAPGSSDLQDKVEWKSDNPVAYVTREVDGGLQTLALQLPAVITADLRLNEPRYIGLPQIMQAKRHTLETIEAADLGADIKPQLNVLGVAPRPQRSKKGVEVESVEALVEKLRVEEGLLP